MTKHDVDFLRRRQSELTREIEELSLLADEDELAEARLESLSAELEEVERKLNPEGADRRRRAGRSEID